MLSKFELPGYFDIRDSALSDDRDGWKIAIVIQKKVQFDRSFSTAKVSPVKHRVTQIDNGGIHANQLVSKRKD